MPRLKCVRYETFARKYVVLGNVAEAYRQTRRELHLPPNRHPQSAKTRGYHIYHRPEVTRRIGELRDRQMKKADITLDNQLTKLEAAYKMAELMSKPSEMINAVNAQSKHVGLLTDKTEVRNVSAFEGADSVEAILQVIADQEGPEAALKMAAAFGLEPAEAENEQTAELLNKAPPTDSVN